MKIITTRQIDSVLKRRRQLRDEGIEEEAACKVALAESSILLSDIFTLLSLIKIERLKKLAD